MVSGIFQVLETLDDTNNTNMSNVGIKCRALAALQLKHPGGFEPGLDGVH